MLGEIFHQECTVAHKRIEATTRVSDVEIDPSCDVLTMVRFTSFSFRTCFHSTFWAHAHAHLVATAGVGVDGRWSDLESGWTLLSSTVFACTANNFESGDGYHTQGTIGPTRTVNQEKSWWKHDHQARSLGARLEVRSLEPSALSKVERLAPTIKHDILDSSPLSKFDVDEHVATHRDHERFVLKRRQASLRHVRRGVPL